MAKLLSKEKATKVYDILVANVGANETERDDFIYHHCTYSQGCLEWRFRGLLGFGGKYRSSWNGVTCYPEDSTPELEQLKQKVNKLLKEINLEDKQ